MPYKNDTFYKDNMAHYYCLSQEVYILLEVKTQATSMKLNIRTQESQYRKGRDLEKID